MKAFVNNNKRNIISVLIILLIVYALYLIAGAFMCQFANNVVCTVAS